MIIKQTLLEIIEDYGSECRWVGHYHAIRDNVLEDSAEESANELLEIIKMALAPNTGELASNCVECSGPNGFHYALCSKSDTGEEG